MKAFILMVWLGVSSAAFAGFLDAGGWVVDGEPEPLPPPVGLSSNSIDPVTDAAYRAVPSWAEVLGIGAIADRDVSLGGHSITGVASVVVSNTVDAGGFSASGTVGRTSAVHGFQAGLLTDTNALGSFVAGVSAGVSGTDKVTKAYVDSGDVAATNAADILAGQKYVTQGGAVTAATFRCLAYDIWIKSQFGDATDFARIINSNSLAWTYWLPAKDGVFAMMSDLPSTAGMVTNGGNATLGTVSVTNVLDAGSYSASGTVGRTSSARGFKAGLMTDTNALDTYMAGVAANVSGTDKVTKAYVDAGDVAATNAANVLAGQKYVPLGAAVTNGGNASLGTVSVSNVVDAGSYSASGTVGRTSSTRGFKAGLLTDTNALDVFMAGVAASVSGTDKVTKVYVDAGDIAATNAANVLAGQKYVPLGSAVTNGGTATLGAVSATSLTIGGNAPLTSSVGASLVFYVNQFTQDVTLVNTDTGAVPNQAYGIELKAAGGIARDTYSGWSTGTAKYVVGPSLAGRDLNVSFSALFQGTSVQVSSGFAKKRKITIPTVIGTLTNFPVLVKFSAGEYAAFEGTNGVDLRFADTNGNELAFEVETWSTGAFSYVWVKVPVLQSGTEITAYWGKPNVAAPIYTVDGSVWSNFNLVAHMTQSNLLDSSSLRNSADRNGIQTNANGVVDKGRGFLRGDGIGWQPNFPSAAGTGMSTGFTIEAWVNKINTGGSDGFIGMYQSGGWPNVDIVKINTDGSDVPYLNVRRSAVDEDVNATAGSAFPLNQWVHLVGMFDGTYMYLYTNGVQAGKSASSPYARNMNANPWYIGSYPDASGYQNIRFTGVIDEIRLSNVPRGSNWVWATYRTVASNATWQTYGVIEDNDSDWPAIFVNGVPVAAGTPHVTGGRALDVISAWLPAVTNGTAISFGARLRKYGNSLKFSVGGGSTGAVQKVSISAF